MSFERAYFAASNTCEGFVSYYNEIFDKCKRIYIIKGGSGTGKNRFMRECAEHVKKYPECKKIEYFYCSFDPDSLDGVIINDTVAIIDGTAPHIYEPTLPGAKENLIDLGAFWDSEKLAKSADTLIELFAQKKACFSRAYSRLGICGKLDDIKHSIAAPYLDEKKLIASVAKLISEIECDKEQKSTTRIISALGRKGRVSFDTYRYIAPKVYEIYDSIGLAYLWIDRIIWEAKRFDLPITVSYDPLFSHRPNGVLIGEAAAIIITDDESKASYNINEYMCGDLNTEAQRIVDINKMQKSFIFEAVKEFEQASNIHFGIEEIYVNAMDFSKKEEFTAKFLSKFKI